MQGLTEIASLVIAALAVIIAWQQHRAAKLAKLESTFREIHQWVDDAIQAMADATHLLDRDAHHLALDEGRQQVCNVRARLSGIADRGRLFFPNMGEDPGKRKGFRRPILDKLIEQHADLGKVLTDLAHAELSDLRNQLFERQRSFVDEAHLGLDTHQRVHRFRRETESPSG